MSGSFGVPLPGWSEPPRVPINTLKKGDVFLDIRGRRHVKERSGAYGPEPLHPYETLEAEG